MPHHIQKQNIEIEYSAAFSSILFIPSRGRSFFSWSAAWALIRQYDSEYP